MRYAAAVSLSAAATVPLAAALAARYVPPSTVWWPQLAALALPVLGGVSAPSALWLWRAASRSGGARDPAARGGGRASRLAGRSLASLQGALVLLACVQYVAGRVPAGAGTVASDSARGVEPDRAPTLTVVSLNAGKATGRSGPLANLLGAVRPDVVALQEAAVRLLPVADAPGGVAVAAPPGASALAAHASYRLAMPATSASDLPPQGAVVRNPVFVRADRVGRPERAGPGGDPVRLAPGESSGTYTRVMVEWAGRPVAIYSVHLRSFGAWREAERAPGLAGLARYARRSVAGLRRDLVRRAAEAERLRAVLDAEPLPYLVAGDLNSTPAQWAYRRVAGGAHDALALNGGLYPRTFPSGSPLVRIDAVLASQDFDVVDAFVGPTGLSDHRPVVAQVRFRPSPQELSVTQSASAPVFSVSGSPEAGGSL